MKLQARPKGLNDVKRAAAPDWGRPRTENKPDKGLESGSCNRTACQAPLAEESFHQFMALPFTSGERLYYCARCARDFDDWDRRSGDMVRITREAKF